MDTEQPLSSRATGDASRGVATVVRGLHRRAARRWARMATIAILAAAMPACKSKEPETGASPAVREKTTVRVENRSYLDHNVYVLRGGQRIRLGMVTGNSTQVFTIPDNLIFGVSALQFLVDPIGASRQPVSNEIRVSPGDQVQLVIPPA